MHGSSMARGHAEGMQGHANGMHAWLLHAKGHAEGMHGMAGMHCGPEACRSMHFPKAEGNSGISVSHRFMCENCMLVLKA
jgi:hypothetical protein